MFLSQKEKSSWISTKASICFLDVLKIPFSKKGLLLVSKDLGAFSPGSLTNHSFEAGAEVEEITVLEKY